MVVRNCKVLGFCLQCKKCFNQLLFSAGNTFALNYINNYLCKYHLWRDQICGYQTTYSKMTFTYSSKPSWLCLVVLPSCWQNLSTVRHMSTCQSTQNWFCATYHYSRCHQQHFLPWWHTHKHRCTANSEQLIITHFFCKLWKKKMHHLLLIKYSFIII